MEITVISIPDGFVIRKKADCETFLNECMVRGNSYYIIKDGVAIIFNKDSNENVNVLKKFGDLTNPFNPELEVANQQNPYYESTVSDIVWKYRKEINAKFLK